MMTVTAGSQRIGQGVTSQEAIRQTCNHLNEEYVMCTVMAFEDGKFSLRLVKDQATQLPDYPEVQATQGRIAQVCSTISQAFVT